MSRGAGRPLDARGRRRAFAVAVGVLGISSVLLMQLPQEQGTDGVTGTPTVLGVARTAPLPAATAPAPATTTAAAPAPPFGVAAQRAAIECARRFLSAYLRFEVGDDDATVRAALRATATPAFAHELLAKPPRLGAAAPQRPGQIDGLELSDGPRATRLVVAATIRRATTVTPLMLRLAREEGGWRISGLE